jgi:hypothetical protein
MDDRIFAASPQLLAANRRLHELRVQVQNLTSGLPVEEPAESAVCRMIVEPLPVSQTTAVATPALANVIATLPLHLGWGSEALTAVLRRQHQEYPHPVDALSEVIPEPVSETETETAVSTTGGTGSDTNLALIKLYPDIGLGMLRQEMEAAGRLWLMLHHLDPQGSGVIRVDLLLAHLTNKSSDLYLCGRRQLRNLLRTGEGVYWTRDKTRVWLRSTARVAAALGVERLTGRPVALRVAALRDGIGTFRAHLYAAFHSGRAREEMAAGMPVARETLANLSGVGASSQRAYEARLGVQAQTNFAIGEARTEAEQEEQAWRHGRALFDLHDHKGEQGRAGKTYLAWQLPNSYTGQHPQRPKGRQKRINRQLQDLVTQGMPGNDGAGRARREPAGGQRGASKRYYPNGRAAGQSRHSGNGLRYWRRPGTGDGRPAIWHPLEQA